MAQMIYRDAVLTTIAEEMERDPNVVVLGEDVVGGMGTAGGPEAIGGIWGTSAGLFGRFGKDRVIDTPISESAIMGAAGGLALSGKRPVAELMFADFAAVISSTSTPSIDLPARAKAASTNVLSSIPNEAK